jgi:hypothetical protein
MATHDYIISNASGSAVRADLNNALAAIATNNSSATEPTTTYAYQWWADTGSSPTVMKLRNAANSAWITLFQLDGEWTSIAFENGTAAAPSIYFKDSGTDTGFYSPGANQVGISTGGTSALVVDSSQRVGIGTTSPTRQLSLFASTAPVIQFINSTTGSTANDGTLLYQTSSNFIIENQEAGEIRFTINGSQRATIDSSGRLLLGVSSTSSNSSFIAQGYSGGSGPGIIRITTTESSPTTDGDLGYIVFGDSAHCDGLYIRGQRDGGTWSASSKPSKLSFHTTPNGASTPTERVRITNTGETRITGGGTGTNQALFVQNSTPSRLLGVREDGYTQWGVATNSPYNFGVSSSTKAMFMDSSGGFGFNSSIRAAKTNIELAPSAGWIGNLNVVTFNYRLKNQAGDYSDDYSDEMRWGVIADDAEAVCPDFCSYDSEGKLDGFHYDRLVPVLLKALQESNKRIETLEAEVAALKGA